jgi:hypothetical protein
LSINLNYETKNKWGILSEYGKGDYQNKEIIKNTIDERINHNINSMEDINIKNSKCMNKKQNIAKILRNNFSSDASGDRRAMDVVHVVQSRVLSDPRSQQALSSQIINQTLQDRRGVKSKNPKTMKTLNLTNKNKSFLQPIASK